MGTNGGDVAQGDLPPGQGTVAGRVFVAGSNLPVSGASLRTAQGQTAATDAQGNFTFAPMAPGPVVLSTDAASLAPTVKSVQVEASQTTYLELFLTPVDVQGTFNAQSGGVLRDDGTGAKALFPGNSLVDATGNMVTGEVDIALASIDPTNVDELRSFPGEFRAIRSDNSEVSIVTYGPMEISVSKDGQPLNLMPGQSAEIAFPIYDTDAPATIELWSLNEATGLWTEEGIAYRTEDEDGNPIYQARIGHLSWWNPDKPIERTCVRACVTDGGVPVRGAMVTALGVGYGYEASATTGSDGCASVRVRRNHQASLQAAGLAGVSPSVIITAPNVPEASDPAACTMVQALVLAPRPPDGCPSGMTKCGGSCVDLTMSPNNCGVCGVTCGGEIGPRNSTCVAGVCSCAGNQILCDGACVDPTSDRFNCGGCSTGLTGMAGAPDTGSGCSGPECCQAVGLAGCPVQDRFICVDMESDRDNCGGCGTACAAGQNCREGSCVALTCSTGQTVCGDRCIEGPCGQTCATGQQCAAGTCTALMCPASLQLCGNDCVDTQSDARNCGSCGNDCRSREGGVCNGGVCGCPAGSSECTIDGNQTLCLDLTSDRDNCGACGKICPTGTVCASGQCSSVNCPLGQILCGNNCVDVNTDPNHCGGCTSQGSEGQGGSGDGPPAGGAICEPGFCMCSQGYKECSYRELAACVDVQNDGQNCGDCGIVCQAGTRCAQGSCQPISCPQGSILCSDTCVFGSSCGENCNADGEGKVCVGGSCQCPAGWAVCNQDGRSVCSDTSTDDRNCGTCGNACDSGFECRQSQCQAIVCPQGQLWCDGCVDPLTDSRNCGGCTVRAGASAGCGREGCCESFGATSCPSAGGGFLCTDLEQDEYNCGSCGTTCAGSQTCSNGQCVALVCPPGRVACSHQCVFGSVCGTTCQESQICSAGTCQGAP